MTVLNKDTINAKFDAFITTVATEFNLSLEQAVDAILQCHTVNNVLAGKTNSVGLVRQDQVDPVKERQLMNAAASDESVGATSPAEYAAQLAAALQQLATCASLDDAAQHSGMAAWLRDLPANDKGHEVGLEYTDPMVRTIFFRLQEKTQQLLGSVIPEFKSSYDDLLTETRKEIKKSVEKRLKTTTTDDAVELETNTMMEAFTQRCDISANTEWVLALHSKKIPVPLCAEFLIALFIFSVDLKWCDCSNLAEFKANFKTQRTKPAKPDQARVHGYNRAPWAVMNWINRIKGSKSSLMAHEQALLSRTLELMQPFTEMLDRALDCLPAVGMRAVFRGVPVRLSDQFEINDEFTMEPHTSTSLEGEEALTFMDPKKPGAFFVLRLHSPAMIDFMSAYPHQAEALLAMHSSFRVAKKLSRTVLRMLGCRFDVITLTEGGSNATNTEQIDFLRRSAKQTFFIYREYLNGMIPIRIALAASSPNEEPSSPSNATTTSMLLDTVNNVVDRLRTSADKKQHVVITGDAGCGKTSATLSAYSHLVQQDGCYAALVPLPSVKHFGSDSDVDDALLEALNITAECFVALCKSFRVFIILDSLDEVGDLTGPLVEEGLLSRNKLLHQAASVITSCRSELFDILNIKQKGSCLVGTRATDNTDDVSIWTIAPFSEDDSNEMIKRHAMRDGTVSEAELLQHASCAPIALQRHPLYLQMILRIPAGTLESGATRITVYKRFIDAIVADAYSDEKDRSKAHSRLQQLALYEMLAKEQWQVTVGTAKKVLGCSGEELELLPFRVDDPHDSKSQLGFLHRSQAEYLAAMELSKAPKDIKTTMDRVAATAKRGTLFFALENENETVQEAAIAELLEGCGEGAALIARLEEDLKRREAAHGKDSVELAWTLKSLANAYRRESQNEKFFELVQRALDLQERHYGPDHIELASTLVSVGDAYAIKRETDKVIHFMERALQLQEKHYGQNHIETAATLARLGTAHGGKRDLDKFLEMTERALAIQEKHYGPDHIHLAGTLTKVGVVYNLRGQSDRFLETTARALRLQEKHYGPEHIALVPTISNMSGAYSFLRDFVKAVECKERAIKLKEKHFGPDHIDLATMLVSLSRSYGQKGGDPEKELELLERALRIQEAHYGPDGSKEMIDTLKTLQITHERRHDHEKVLEFSRKGLQIAEKHLSDFDPARIAFKSSVEKTEKILEDSEP